MLKSSSQSKLFRPSIDEQCVVQQISDKAVKVCLGRKTGGVINTGMYGLQACGHIGQRQVLAGCDAQQIRALRATISLDVTFDEGANVIANVIDDAIATGNLLPLVLFLEQHFTASGFKSLFKIF